MLGRIGRRRLDASRDVVGHRRRPVHTGLGVFVAVLFVAVELLVVRSYQHAASTSASLHHATDVTTTLANVSREALLIQAEVLTLRSEGDFDAITLRRALLDRQVRIVDARNDPELAAGIQRLGVTLDAIDSELAALEAQPLDPEAARQRLRPLFAELELQTKQLFDSQEHRLYGALDVDVRGSERDQLLLVGLGGFVLLLAIILTFFLRRSIRADFGRAHEALKVQIVEREALQQELAHQAFHDPLTGLPNRAFFVEEAARALARARRRPDSTLAMLYLDLDDFKSVNDTLGHAAGDALLRVMAERMGACLRESDTVARLGGDEFGIILEGDGGPQDIANVAARLVDSARRPIDVLGRQVEVGASVGVALAPPDSDVSHLMQSADLAMYEAKNAGKGGWLLFDPQMRGRVDERRQLEHDLAVAVTDGQLVCFYQPVVNLGTGEIESFEALVRWRHPSGTLLEPAAFIDAAEESGIILALGDVVLEQACRQGVAWSAIPGGSNLSVCVNVSGRQLQEPGFAGRIQKTLERTGMEASRLIVEITERVMMQETDATVRVLGELRTLGVRVAIDDFGIGYSSLSYLRFLPIDILKIDRSFVQAADQGKLIAESIVRLADTLGLTAVAEGIEDEEQLTWLRSLGCDLGQGYLFARPMPAEEATHMIGERWPMPDDSSVLVDVR